MIEKLKSNNGNVEPMHKIYELAKKIKDLRGTVTVAEIGIGWGATAVELVENLGKEDTYYFFDFEENVKELYDDLCEINKNSIHIIGVGNSHKRYDSYSWNIAKLLLDWKRENGNIQRFDVVYLDGAHTFMHDASAACLLKEMVTVGGYIVLDDINWSIANSPTCNPTDNPGIEDSYTEEQINACQVKVVEECFLADDVRYNKIGEYNRIAIYQRVE